MYCFWLRKRYLCILINCLCIGIFLTLSACSGGATTPKTKVASPTQSESQTIQTPTDLINAGFLTVGSYLEYPPQAFSDQISHQPTGFDIDLITEIARRLNLKITIVNTPYSSLVDNVVQGELDVAIAAIPITETLKAKVHFVPYFKGGEVLLVQRGNPLHIRGLDDLCGKRVAALKNSLEQSDLNLANTNCTESGKPSIEVIVANKYTSMMGELTSKRIDATFQDLPLADSFIDRNPNLVEQAGPIMNITTEGIAISKDERGNLYSAIEAVLNAMQQDGTYQKLVQKWGLTNGAIA